MPSAARVLVDQLLTLGADTAFGVPGESYLAVLDALVDVPGLRYVACRQESGATFAADAHARLTGRPGIAMVTRGPGATNASIGVHTALHDEIPMILFVGLIPRRQRGRDAFQEFDLESMFASLAKATVVVDEASDISGVVHRAWMQAVTGRPGPVVIGLPEDVLEIEIDGDLISSDTPDPPRSDERDLDAVRSLLARAERPLTILGGSTWTDSAVALVPDALVDVPLVAAFRHQDLVDHRASTTAGVLGLVNDPGLVTAVREADVILAIGTRLDDPTTGGYTLVPPSTPLVHVHPLDAEIGRNHPVTVGIAARADSFIEALGTVAPSIDRSGWCMRTRASYEAWAAGGDGLEAMVRGIGEAAPADTIVTNGAGNFSRPFHRSYPYGRPGRQLAPANGSMGYGLPAALAAAVTRRDRPVLCVAGDGDLLMTGQEMATIAAVGARVTVLVVDNASYGTIRTHQERRYPGRRSATDLVNPDFAAWARSFGASAHTTDDPDEAAALVTACLGTFSLVHLRTAD